MDKAIGPRAELRYLIGSKIAAGMTPAQVVDAIMALFHSVDDEWQELDVSSVADPGAFLDQRWLVCRIPRQADLKRRVPDRIAGLRPVDNQHP